MIICKTCKQEKENSCFRPRYKECKQCQNIKHAVYRASNKENQAILAKRWNDNNRERRSITEAARHIANKDKINSRISLWKKNNKKQVLANVRSRKFAKLKRTPPWADLEAIKQFYINCPEGFEVDHVIPLQGKLVSGLHVLNNLQYLTEYDNRVKGNKFNG